MTHSRSAYPSLLRAAHYMASSRASPDHDQARRFEVIHGLVLRHCEQLVAQCFAPYHLFGYIGDREKIEEYNGISRCGAVPLN